MISCDECQKKIVASFDNEGSEGDEALLSGHLKDCSDCRAFHEDMVKLRQEFVSVPVPSPPTAMAQEVMRQTAPDSVRGKTSRPEKRLSREPWRPRFRRLAWASGLAVLAVVALSSLVCLTMSKKVQALTQELQIAQRDVAFFRAEKRLSELQERQEKEQKAITALYLQMGELEQRFDQVYSPRTAFLPTEGAGLNALSERRSPL